MLRRSQCLSRACFRCLSLLTQCLSLWCCRSLQLGDAYRLLEKPLPGSPLGIGTGSAGSPSTTPPVPTSAAEVGHIDTAFRMCVSLPLSAKIVPFLVVLPQGSSDPPPFPPAVGPPVRADHSNRH